MKKILKNKQIVMIALVAAIMVAGAWNYITSQDEAVPATGIIDVNDIRIEPTEEVPDETPKAPTDYFAKARLDRALSRSRMLEILDIAISNRDSSEEDKQQAQEDMRRTVAAVENEAVIESLICAKGFDDCVVFITEGGVSAVVQAGELAAAEVAQIKSIIVEKADVPTSQIKIITY